MYQLIDHIFYDGRHLFDQGEQALRLREKWLGWEEALTNIVGPSFVRYFFFGLWTEEKNQKDWGEKVKGSRINIQTFMIC